MAAKRMLGDSDEARIGEKLKLATRRFNAWWEGYAFDEAAERAAIAAQVRGPAPDPVEAISEIIWGAGRSDPGDAAWSMRHARLLGLAPKARAAVFGAGGGAPAEDIRIGMKWRVDGFTHLSERTGKHALTSYRTATTSVARNWADGALSFFDLHRDADPAAFAAFVAENIKPGGPAAFIDFAAPKKSYRLRGCFAAPLGGAVVDVDQVSEFLSRAGFRVGDWTDETQSFQPLVAKGWARWRHAWNYAASLTDSAEKAAFVHALAGLAHVWAERFDALRGGQLQVVRVLARKI